MLLLLKRSTNGLGAIAEAAMESRIGMTLELQVARDQKVVPAGPLL